MWRSDCDTLPPPPASNFPIAKDRKEWSDTEGKQSRGRHIVMQDVLLS